MEFQLLGSLEETDGERSVEFGGGKPRALLALLLLHANEVVTTDRLIEELWGDAAPTTAAKSVQLYVSRIRRALGGDPILHTRAGGYCLQLDDWQLDLN